MASIVIKPPYKEAEILPLVSHPDRGISEMARRDLDWALTIGDPRKMAAEIASRWRETSLPLREWADRIEKVEFFVPQAGFDPKYRVTLTNSPLIIDMNALFSIEEYHRLLYALPVALPKPLAEIAYAAPGLELHEDGSLMWPSFFMHPLDGIKFWFEGEAWRRRICLDDCVMEFAEDNMFNGYVLMRDGSTTFFFHYDAMEEEDDDGNETIVKLHPCKVTVEELVERFFLDSPNADPSCLGDYDWILEDPECLMM